jgi:hypothetical protein
MSYTFPLASLTRKGVKEGKVRGRGKRLSSDWHKRRKSLADVATISRNMIIAIQIVAKSGHQYSICTCIILSPDTLY